MGNLSANDGFDIDRFDFRRASILPKGHHAHFHDPVEPSGQPARSACSVATQSGIGAGSRCSNMLKCQLLHEVPSFHFSLRGESRIVKCRTSFTEYDICGPHTVLCSIEDASRVTTSKLTSQVASCQAARIPPHFVWKPGNDAAHRLKGRSQITQKSQVIMTNHDKDRIF